MPQSRPSNLAEEAQRLVDLLDAQQLIIFLGGQLAVVRARAQLLLGLCGLAITVTGFSGTHMIKGGRISAMAMVAGIALIMVGAIICLAALLKIRWVSQEIADPLSQTAERILTHRNAQQVRIGRAGIVIALGLGFYMLSVAITAFQHIR